MISVERWDDYEVYKVENNSLALWIISSHGANLFRIRDKKGGIELLHSPRNPDTLRRDSVLWGTPILFPPNRIAKGTFQESGNTFAFPINTPEGHHIHGLLHDKPWRFASLSESDDEGASISFSLDLMDFPELMEAYPVPLCFEMQCSLFDTEIVQTVRVANRGKSRAPVGLGLHSWFRLEGGRDRWSVTMPYEKLWELGDDVMPTGKLLDPKEMRALQHGMPLSGKQFDTIFYLGAKEAAIACCRDDGYGFSYAGSATVRHWVLHTPASFPDVIAFEPYTWITNAPNLSLDRSITGYQVLDVDATLALQTRFHLS